MADMIARLEGKHWALIGTFLTALAAKRGLLLAKPAARK